MLATNESIHKEDTNSRDSSINTTSKVLDTIHNMKKTTISYKFCGFMIKRFGYNLIIIYICKLCFMS